jgi:hypothetical protein
MFYVQTHSSSTEALYFCNINAINPKLKYGYQPLEVHNLKSPISGFLKTAIAEFIATNPTAERLNHSYTAPSNVYTVKR